MGHDQQDWIQRLPPAQRQLLGLEEPENELRVNQEPRPNRPVAEPDTPHENWQAFQAEQEAQAIQPREELASPSVSLTTETPTNPLETLLHQAATRWDETINPHLNELRGRLFWCGSTVILTSVLGLLNAAGLIRLFQKAAPSGTQFIQLQPGEVLWLTLKVALLFGVALSLPVIGFHALRFILPGMNTAEKRWALPLLAVASVLLLIGLLFSGAILLPVSLAFLIHFGQDIAMTQLSVGRYVDFCLLVLMLGAASFELPIMLFALAKLGLVRSQHIQAQWRTWVVGAFIAAALLTPGQDPLSMGLVALILLALLAASVWALKLLRL